MRVFPFLSLAAMILRAPDDGGAGGTPDPAADPAPPADASGQQEGAPDGGLFDLADETDPAPDPDGKPQRPAWLQEKFWDAEKGAPKVEDLARANTELRTLIAKGQQKPPANPDGYTVPAVEGVEDPLAALGGKEDPLWQQVRTAAHGAGVSQAQMAAILGPVLAAAAARQAAAGDQAPPDPEAAALAAQEARRAELAKLGPNGMQVVKQTGAWLAGLEAKGMFTAGEIAAAKSIATAEGIRFLAKLRSLTGEQAIPVDAFAADGAMTQADAERMMTEGFRKNDMALVAKGRAVLEKMDKAGQLRA